MFPDNILVLGRDLEWFIGREIKVWLSCSLLMSSLVWLWWRGAAVLFLKIIAWCHKLCLNPAISCLVFIYPGLFTKLLGQDSGYCSHWVCECSICHVNVMSRCFFAGTRFKCYSNFQQCWGSHTWLLSLLSNVVMLLISVWGHLPIDWFLWICNFLHAKDWGFFA